LKIEEGTCLEAIQQAATVVMGRGEEFLRASGSWCMADKPMTKMIEVQNATIIVHNPLFRWNTLVSRGNLVETADFLLGLNPGFISDFWDYYRKKVALRGKLPYTYGERIFGGEIDQWKHVVKLLRENPTSRHASILMHRVIDRTRDYVPCTFVWHFQVDENKKLNMTTVMRSQDVFKGLPGDLFAFTLFHEQMALETKLELGKYTHFCCNLHLYEPGHDKALEKIFKAKEPKSALEADLLTEDLKFEFSQSFYYLSLHCYVDRRLKLKQLENFVTSTKGYWENYINLIAGGYPDPK